MSDRVTRELAKACAGFRLDDLPERVVERSKHIALDALGCAVSGLNVEWTARARTGALDLEPNGGTATVWGTGERASPGTAALVNATAIQAWEMDDYHLLGPLHGGAVTLTSALATAEHVGVDSGRALLEAVALGQEVGPRIGYAMGGMELIRRGWHNGAVYGTLASVAAAGRIRQLTADQFEHALGIAATQACGLMAAQYEAMVTYMHHGFAARSGVLAAALADAGVTGVPDVLDRAYGGFASNFSDVAVVDWSRALADFGERWEIERVAIKPYACMAGVHLPIELVSDIVAEEGLNPADLSDIEVAVAEWLVTKGSYLPEQNIATVAAQMSIAYGVAIAVHDSAVLPRQYQRDRIEDPEVLALARRVRVVHDTEVDQLGPESSFSCTVKVTAGSGEVFQRSGRHPLGSHLRPISNEEIREKYRTVVSDVVGPKTMDHIEATVLNIENSNVSDLLEALAEAGR